MPNLGINTHSAPLPEQAVVCRAKITNCLTQTVRIAITGICDHVSSIDWGDGNSTVCQYDGRIQSFKHSYSREGFFLIRIIDDLDSITAFDIAGQSYLGVEIDTLRYLTALESLNAGFTSSVGNITVGLKPLTSLESVNLGQESPTAEITGELSVFAAMPSIAEVTLNKMSCITGSFHDIGSLRYLVRVLLAGTMIGGDISGLALLPLDELDISNTQASGYTGISLRWNGLDATFDNLTGLGASAISQLLQDVDAIAKSDGSLAFGSCGVKYGDLDSFGKSAHDNLIGRGWDITLDS